LRLPRLGSTGRRRTVFLVIALLSILAGLILYRNLFPFIQQVDLRLKDARLALRGDIRPTAPVSVVAIDNRSIKELGRWPWSRELTARLISAIARQGAKVAALDMVFSEPQGEAPDRALGASVAAAGNVVMGYFFRSEPQPDDAVALEQLAQSRVSFLRIAPHVESVPLPSYEQVDTNIARLGKGAAGFGYFNPLPDADGLYRAMPLLMLFRGDVYPSLALSAVSHYRGEALQVDIEQFGVSGVRLGNLVIPVGEQGKLPLFYYGAGGAIPTVSAVDVINGRLPGGALKGRLVFVGVTETAVADLRAAPLDPNYPGVELHATFAANALEQKFLTRDSRTLGIEMTAMALLPLLLALLLASVPGALWGLAGLLLLTAGYLGVNFHLFTVQRFDLSIIYPLAPLVFTYLGGESYRNLVVERKGRHLRKAFSTYLSPDLVATIAKNPDSLKLGGEKRNISVLFSDIRGFTTLSEGLTPEELVSLLNRYLSPMTSIVMEERGTLDKFIGDAVMAFFNAPLEVPDHAAKACQSALRMLHELKKLNVLLKADGLPEITIGIGIHTGEAVVGNMGADIRFDYTAIGDSVNLASRLEGLTKQYGVSIIVSEETCRQAGKGFSSREIDLVQVKGKTKPVAVYELMMETGMIAETFAGGLKLYRERDFAGALGIFEQLQDSDSVSRLYVTRCREFLAEPPGVEWDGMYVAQTK